MTRYPSSMMKHEAAVLGLFVFLLSAPTASAQWSLDVPDGPHDVGRYSSLVLDAGGNSHIAYIDNTAGDLKYAVRDSLGWSIETIDSNCGSGQGMSLVLDAAGDPRVAYHRYNNWGLYYAYRDAGGWHYAAIVSGGSNVGKWPSMVLDSTGYEHILWEGSSRVKHAWRGPSGWSTEVVDTTSNEWDDNNPVASFDSLGRLCVAYRKRNALKFAVLGTSAWMTEVVDSTDGDAEIGMGRDPAGKMHIIYGHGLSSSARPWHAAQTDSGWLKEQIEDYNSQALSAAVDHYGTVHAFYTRKFYSDLALKHASLIGGTWHTEFVYGPGSREPQSWHSPALSMNGLTLGITCYDQDGGDLMVFRAKYDSVGPSVPVLITPPNDTVFADSGVSLMWTGSSDDSSGLAGYRVELAYDSGFTHIWQDSALTDTSMAIEVPDTMLYWRVLAFDSAQNSSAWSEIRRFRYEPPTGLELAQAIDEPAIRLAPCPFGQTLHVECTKGEPTVVEIYSADGRAIASLRVGRTTAGGSNTWDGVDNHGTPAPPGVYFLRAKTRAGLWCARVTRIR